MSAAILSLTEKHPHKGGKFDLWNEIEPERDRLKAEGLIDDYIRKVHVLHGKTKE